MSAPNLKEIEWAIAELEQGESSFSVYAALANLYTVRNEMLGMSAPQPQTAAYSMAAPTSQEFGRYGNSDFLRAVEGKDPGKVWPIVDDFMDSLRVVNRRAYDHLVQRLGNV